MRKSLSELTRKHTQKMKNKSVIDEMHAITAWYVEKVQATLDATDIRYKFYRHTKPSIRFVVIVDSTIQRDHSFQLSDIACELDELYPDWDFDFQYVTTRTAAQLPLDAYSNLTSPTTPSKPVFQIIDK